jgi:replication-associated recombination protein RarA
MIRTPGFYGGAMLFTGPSGVGKSTVGRMVVDELVGDAPSRKVYLAGDRCTETRVQELRDMLQPSMFGAAWFGVLVDECHKMTQNSVGAWLNALDHLAPNVVVVFTTTESPPVKGTPSETDAFVSRALHLEFVPDDETQRAFADYLCRVARGASMGGECAEDAWKLLVRKKWNLRKALNDIPKGALIGKGTQTTSMLETKRIDLAERLLAGRGGGE